MLLLISQTKDTSINLATEDYLLKNSTENIVYLYINRPCVVVGKHQNAMAEVNYRFLCENNIPLYRRISGGGTVFHDEGNINFTFIQNGEEGNLVNFRGFIEPIRDFLISLGVSAEIGPRNDILVNGLKVSGNAEHVYRKRTLHHGTLLFSSSLNFLRNALRIEEGKYTDKAVKSVRSKVTNLKDYIKDEFTAEQFYFKLGTFLMNRYQAESLLLEPNAINSINEIAGTKYSDWTWNYGYSPDYNFQNSIQTNAGIFQIELIVEKGIILNAAIKDEKDDSLVHLQELLKDQPHNYDTLKNIQDLNPKYADLKWAFF